MSDDGAPGGLGALDVDRRWRWLLVGRGVPAVLGLLAMLLLPVVATVLVYRLGDGLGTAFRFVLAAVPGLVVMLADTLGVPIASRTRPWLRIVGAFATSRRSSRPVDAAGLVREAYAAAGVDLPDTTAEQYRQTQRAAVDVNHLRPGDLMFWATGPPAGATASNIVQICHVAIYLGRGNVISASPAGHGVAVRPIRTEEAEIDARLGDIPGERHCHARLHAATRPRALR